MRNAVLPFVPPPSYDFGHVNFDLQILNETLQNGISGVCLDNKHEAVENFPFSFNSSYFTYQSPGFQTNTSTMSFEGDNALLGKILAPQLDVDFPTTRNSRKRLIEGNDLSPKRGVEEQLSQKRSKVSNNDQLKHTSTQSPHHKLEMPTRKSQKLADKITALQKLVSPYGKTDTASVLQEASLYIKLLQEQIQNLFRMLSSSCNGIRVHNSQESGKRQVELSSRGLCLVPISFTHNLKLELLTDHKYHHY